MLLALLLALYGAPSNIRTLVKVLEIYSGCQLIGCLLRFSNRIAQCRGAEHSAAISDNLTVLNRSASVKYFGALTTASLSRPVMASPLV